MNKSPYLYLRSNSSVYWVKKRVPKELQNCKHPFLLSGKGRVRAFFYKSTGASDLRTANRVCARIIAEWDKLFDAILLEHKSLSALDNTSGVEDGIPVDLSAFGEHKRHLAIEIGAAREYIVKARQDPQFIVENQRRILVDAGAMAKSGWPDNWFERSEYATIQHDIDMAGDFDAMADMVESNVAGFGGYTMEAVNASREARRYVLSEEKMTFGEAVHLYMVKRKAEASRLSHVKTQEATIKLFASLLPSDYKTALENITGTHAVKFASIVGLRWDKLTTQKNRLSHVSAVFEFAKKSLKAVQVNPFEGYEAMLPRNGSKAKLNSRNRAFSEEQLVELLNGLFKFSVKSRSAASVGIFPAAVVALYTGMRLEEVSRIEVGDIRVERGVDYLDIDESKSDAGVRRVPLNRGSKLVLKWLADNKSKPSEQYLFEGLVMYDNRRSKKMSDSFSRWKRSNLDWAKLENEYTFHSFRSTVATCLDRASLPVDYQSLILGHVDGRSSLAQRVYSDGKTLEQLASAVKEVDYGDDVLHLCESLLQKLSGVGKVQ